MSYDQVVQYSGISSLILFIALFAGVLVYALRPGAKQQFDRLARLPLDDADGTRGEE